MILMKPLVSLFVSGSPGTSVVKILRPRKSKVALPEQDSFQRNRISYSPGSACHSTVAAFQATPVSSGAVEPSHVLTAIGLPADKARASLRFSLGRTTHADHVARAVSAIADAVRSVREAGTPA